MELYSFDPEDAFINLTGTSPKGVTEVGIAHICLPDVSSKALLLAYLAEFFDVHGYKRDPNVPYRGLGDGLPESVTRARVFRRIYSRNIPIDFVVFENNDRSSPDISVTAVQAASAGFFANRKIRKDIKAAQNAIPSGWLQPYISNDQRESRVDGDPMFQQLCQVSRSLQMYLYSGGAGVLPEDFSPIFRSDPPPVDVDHFRFLETGPTSDIWSDRPVVECTAPIDGIVFGCTADNTIIPIREIGSLPEPTTTLTERDDAGKPDPAAS